MEVSKGDLIERCSLPSGTMDKLRKNIPVHMKVVERICLEFNCNIEDVVEIKKRK
jgi:DNA-binding Xre family transcriptional regulator